MYANPMYPTLLDAEVHALEMWGMVTLGLVGLFVLISVIPLGRDIWNRRRKK